MFEQLISKRNLLLAWRRITTSGNYQYKRFYRNLYSIYEVALEENIDYLYHRLKANTFTPHPSIRTYLPKPSGLQRPIILLFLEDQIVLQAFANLLVEKLREKRLSVEKKAVFSNYLNTPGNIFFVKPWRYSYREYREVLIKQFTLGFRWVAHFDLAAFYDNISHELLIKQLCPRSQHTDIYKFLKKSSKPSLI